VWIRAARRGATVRVAGAGKFDARGRDESKTSRESRNVRMDLIADVGRVREGFPRVLLDVKVGFISTDEGILRVHIDNPHILIQADAMIIFKFF